MRHGSIGDLEDENGVRGTRIDDGVYVENGEALDESLYTYIQLNKSSSLRLCTPTCNIFQLLSLHSPSPAV